MLGLSAESAMASLIEPYSSEKIDLPELRPINVLEHKLAVGRLPQQESAQTLFARCAYDEIRVWIWKMGSIQILVKSIFVNLLWRKITLMNIFNNLLGSVDDLGPSRVSDRQV